MRCVIERQRRVQKGPGLGSEQRALRGVDAERKAEIFCLICNRMKDIYRDAQERARALGWHNAGALGAAG